MYECLNELSGSVLCKRPLDWLSRLIVHMLQGIVGTTAGTLWYINWAERASIRLISGHNSKVRTAADSGELFDMVALLVSVVMRNAGCMRTFDASLAGVCQTLSVCGFLFYLC